jgi:ACS family hexuronate transporter-like MFS transporter
MPLSRLRWIILVLLCLSTVINYVDRQALSVLLPTLRKELALTSESYGTITTLFLLAYTVGQPFCGWLVDRLGPKRGMTISISVWSLAAAAHAFCTGPLSLGAFRSLLGIGEAGNWPAGGRVIAEWFPRERRAFAMGLFDGGSAIGAIVAPPLVAVLAIHHGWRSAFVITGLLGLLWLVAWLWIYQPPTVHRWLAPADREKAIAEAAGAAQRQSFFEMLRTMLAEPALWGLMVTRMIATPVWWFYVFWLPDYLAKGRGFTLAEIGLFGWIPYVTVDIGKMIGGGASDRLLARGHSAGFARKIAMAGGALAMAGGLFVAGAQSVTAAITWVSVATFGFGMWSANILALHADIFPAAKMGRALGLTGMAASLGGAFATYAIGRLVDTAGYRPVFFVAGTLSLLAFVFLFFFVRPPTAAKAVVA